eukprot:TRINITY_DN39289_c0_g1_i1.p1 TRINITY_DN39289_c0_g1~~TRINITY_DN39289_c0_g1_i1.p1  ORF type:complete len:175 (+),score=22.61 TRINITY_DN39289_c0_g1_i1:75-527(+)
MTLRRIQKEISEMASNGDLGDQITAGPRGDDMYDWEATITGPEGTPYEGGTFFLSVALPKDYPFKPPVVKFITKIYHCNVGSAGNICMPVLKDQWATATTIAQILLQVRALISEPVPEDSPLSPDIAAEYLANRTQHDATARDWVEKYAK